MTCPAGAGRGGAGAVHVGSRICATTGGAAADAMIDAVTSRRDKAFIGSLGYKERRRGFAEFGNLLTQMVEQRLDVLSGRGRGNVPVDVRASGSFIQTPSTGENEIRARSLSCCMDSTLRRPLAQTVPEEGGAVCGPARSARTRPIDSDSRMDRAIGDVSSESVYSGEKTSVRGPEELAQPTWQSPKVYTENSCEWRPHPTRAVWEVA